MTLGERPGSGGNSFSSCLNCLQTEEGWQYRSPCIQERRTQKFHGGGDKADGPVQVRALRVVDGDAYLQDTLVEVSYFPPLISPGLFERFVTVVVFTPIELSDAFEEL
jgi:hypothetical protein